MGTKDGAPAEIMGTTISREEKMDNLLHLNEETKLKTRKASKTHKEYRGVLRREEDSRNLSQSAYSIYNLGCQKKLDDYKKLSSPKERNRLLILIIFWVAAEYMSLALTGQQIPLKAGMNVYLDHMHQRKY